MSDKKPVIKEIQKGISEITLSVPVEEAGMGTYEKIKFRTIITWGDSKALGDEEGNKIEASMKLFQKLTINPNLPITAIEKMSFTDAEVVMNYLVKIMGADDGKKKVKIR